jgi:hypothetical protein
MTRRILLVALAASIVGCNVAAPASDSPARPSIATTEPNAVERATPSPAAPMTPPPTLPPEDLPSDLDPALAEAIRFRRDAGLRSDLAFVRTVAQDPRTSTDPYDVPLYPEELADFHRRHDESGAVAPIVRNYAGLHADEFGGLYIDEGTRAGVVSLWTDHLAEHAAGVRKAVGPDARVAFGQVRYAEVDLRRLQNQVSAEWKADWMAAIPAAFQSVGVDIEASQVRFQVSSANPDAEAIIEAHYGFGDRMRVESDGTGRILIPWGTVTGRVTGITSKDTWLSLHWTSPDLGDCGGGDMGYGVNDDGRFELPCQVGTWTIIVVAIAPDETFRERGRGTVEVVADKTVTLDIDLDAGS